MEVRFDIAIIGGGTVGTMIFYDACLRGLECILVERGRIGMQTNYASSGLLQIGANYLHKDRDLVIMNAVDCKLLEEIAGRFVRRQKFVFPVFPDSKHPLWLWDGFLTCFDRIAGAVHPKHENWSREKLLANEPMLKKNVLGGAVYSEWVVDPVKFSRALVTRGVFGGNGYVRENSLVIFAVRRDDRMFRIGIKEDGIIDTIKASVVINAAGPWAPRVLEEVFVIPSFKTRMTRGTSIILNKKLCNAGLIGFDNSGKYILILPLDNGRTLVGPTNVDIAKEVAQDPDKLKYDEREIKELLKVASDVLETDVGRRDVREIKCGLRPQLPHYNVKPDHITHEFMIIDHQKRDGVEGLLTVFGGKLSNQVRMAKETVDAAVAMLSRAQPKRYFGSWYVPYLKLIPTGEVEPIMPKNIETLLEFYKKKLALSYQDDVNKIAAIKRFKALTYLTPFILWGFLKDLFCPRRGR